MAENSPTSAKLGRLSALIHTEPDANSDCVWDSLLFCWSVSRWLSLLAVAELFWALLAICLAVAATVHSRLELLYLLPVATLIGLVAICLLFAQWLENHSLLLPFVVWKPLELIVHVAMLAHIWSGRSM